VTQLLHTISALDFSVIYCIIIYRIVSGRNGAFRKMHLKISAMHFPFHKIESRFCHEGFPLSEESSFRGLFFALEGNAERR